MPILLFELSMLNRFCSMLSAVVDEARSHAMAEVDVHAVSANVVVPSVSVAPAIAPVAVADPLIVKALVASERRSGSEVNPISELFK